MLKAGMLVSAFDTYWSDMDRCGRAGAYWSLLHVTVCLPDICAALESNSGEATGPQYIAWCDRYLVDTLLSGAERYRMRCKVLHQGRATTDQPGGRYVGFSFGQPSATGEVDHRRVDGDALNLDVGMLADEMKVGVNRWIQSLETNPSGGEARNAVRNLPSLVQVRQRSFPSPINTGSGTPTFTTTYKTS
jgi:hypothetical protein